MRRPGCGPTVVRWSYPQNLGPGRSDRAMRRRWREEFRRCISAFSGTRPRNTRSKTGINPTGSASRAAPPSISGASSHRWPRRPRAREKPKPGRSGRGGCPCRRPGREPPAAVRMTTRTSAGGGRCSRTSRTTRRRCPPPSRRHSRREREARLACRKECQMRKTVAGVIMSLDGVVESPEKWHLRYFDDELGELIDAWAAQADAMLLGRRTYEEFAAFWPTQGRDVPMADYMNDTPKH